MKASIFGLLIRFRYLWAFRDALLVHFIFGTTAVRDIGRNIKMYQCTLNMALLVSLHCTLHSINKHY
jgi:hypothetical protein